MTRRERVKAAINRTSPDKTPVFIHLTDEARAKYGEQLYKRYASEEILHLRAEGKLSERNSLYYSMGSHVCILDNYWDCPWWWFTDVPADFHGFDVPESLPKAKFDDYFDRFEEYIENIKKYTDAYLLVEIWTSDFEKAYYERGFQNFLMDIVGEPEFAQEFLDYISENNLKMLEKIVKYPGIDGILFGDDFGSQRDLLMSPDTWREMFKPAKKKEFDLIHSAGIDVWLHSCGNIRSIIPDLIEIGVDVLNPIQPECMDIYELKDTFGDKLTFWGGISTQQTLPYGTVEDVEKETRKVTEYFSRNGGYIISGSHTIQADVPFENICKIVDTANEL